MISYVLVSIVLYYLIEQSFIINNKINKINKLKIKDLTIKKKPFGFITIKYKNYEFECESKDFNIDVVLSKISLISDTKKINKKLIKIDTLYNQYLIYEEE